MSFDLTAMRDQMRLSIGSARNVAVFEAGRARHRALAPFASPRKVLAELNRRDPERYLTCEAIVRALLSLHRGRHGNLWSQMLAVTFYPMLRRLRERAATNALPADERDQQVMVAFMLALESSACAPTKRHLALRLRRQTTRILFEALRKAASTTVSLQSDPSPRHEPVSTEPSPLENFEERRETHAVLAQVDIFCRRPKSARAVIAATVLRSEPLAAYVRRVFPGSAQDHRRIYERLKRQRSRLFRHMRELSRPAGDREPQTNDLKQAADSPRCRVRPPQ